MAKPSIDDVVYYWTFTRNSAGRIAGAWVKAIPMCSPDYRSKEQLREDLTRAGYVARYGSHSVGAPDGGPSAEDLATVRAALRADRAY